MTKGNVFLFFLSAITASANTYAQCEIVDGDKKEPFDGKDLKGIDIEKKALLSLNKEFPALNVIEKTFKGEAQTCTNCSEKHITCSK